MIIAGLCLLPMVAGGRAVVVTIFGFLIVGLFEMGLVATFVSPIIEKNKSMSDKLN